MTLTSAIDAYLTLKRSLGAGFTGTGNDSACFWAGLGRDTARRHFR